MCHRARVKIRLVPQLPVQQLPVWTVASRGAAHEGECVKQSLTGFGGGISQVEAVSDALIGVQRAVGVKEAGSDGKLRRSVLRNDYGCCRSGELGVVKGLVLRVAANAEDGA